MYSLYKKWNRRLIPLLWLLVIIALAASAPMAYSRWDSEGTAERVEFVLDYQDVASIAQSMPNPAEYLDQELDRAIQEGISSIAIYESSLSELKQQSRIQLFNARDGALLSGQLLNMDNNFSYLLFDSIADQEALEPLIREALARRGIEVSSWSVGTQPGLRMEQPLDMIAGTMVAPDPELSKSLAERGYHVVLRLWDRHSFDADIVERVLAETKEAGANRIVFAGDAVTGGTEHAERNTVYVLADLMKKYDYGTTYIEFLKQPQIGNSLLTYLLDYNAARLHYLPDNMTMSSPERIADRFVLAVKDRKNRMIYINANASKDLDKGVVKSSLDNLYVALNGPDGAIERIKELGFEIGPVEPYEFNQAPGEKVWKLLILLGAAALIALTAGAYAATLATPTFLAALGGSAALYMMSSSVLSKAMALGASICAPTLAVILAIKTIRAWNAAYRTGSERMSSWTNYGRVLLLFLGVSAISLIGGVYTVGLLNHPTYMLGFDLFRGVSLLHAAPIGLVVIYAAAFSHNETLQQVEMKLRAILNANVKVYYVLVAGVLGLAAMYYMSRTGNAGSVSSMEMLFRGALEDWMGVRPRTKEFLISHPVFIAAAYIAIRNRYIWYALMIGVIGQLSMIDTFAHLHTPLHISLLRVFYGMALGILLGSMLIAVWSLAKRGWHTWEARSNK